MEVDGCTWLTQRKVPQQQMLARYFLLVACLSGIVLKVLVVSAPEVRTARRFLLHFKRQRGVTNHEIGAAVILSLRGYAKMAQEAVQKLALRWRRLGQTKWGAGQLRALMLAWQKIEQTHGKLHAKKVQGLSNRYFGAAWLQKVLAAPDWKTRWDEACEHVGAMCRDPHFASTFRESCKVLAQLPGVGVDYGSKWMVRGGYVLREWVWHAPPLPMTEKEWPVLCDMNEETTGRGFRSLGTNDLTHALIMRVSLAGAMSAAATSSATSAMYRRLQTVELACSVCEAQSMLNVVEASLRKQGKRDNVRKYILERLPASVEDMHVLRSTLLGEAWAHPEVNTGKDQMRASAVAMRYLLRTAEPLPQNAWQRWTEGSVHLRLPVLWCAKCGRLLEDVVRMKKEGGPSATLCAVGKGCRQ